VNEVHTSVHTLKGENLRLHSPDQVVTCNQKMEYFPNTRQARAVGNAKVVRGQDTLSANTITATFKDKSAAAPANASAPAGTGNLDRLDAEGNVVIVTPSETLRGNRGIYRADTNIAELIGNVKIERGPNILEGERAEVNLTTNVSKMFGSESGTGRVRGVFFPGSEKKPGTQAPSPSPTNPATVVP
jgi:lipopolysaccharide export system protein LptA